MFGFVIITIGGVGSLAGTTIAAFFIGILQTVSSYYFESFVVELIIFSTLLLVLLLRPQGLLGKDVFKFGSVRT